MVEKIRILISKTVMVGCCKLSLYANGLVMNMRFIFGEDCNDVISLESRPLNFPVFIYAYSLSIRPSYGARGEEILDGGGGRGRRERKVSLLHLSPFFASIFPLFPRNA